MSVPKSAARALHGALAEVESQRQTAPYHRWQQVFGQAPESVAFARIHTELMSLLTEVLHDIRELPPEGQERYATYFGAWWAALVRPRQDWAADGRLLDKASLDMLASVADVIEMRASLRGQAREDAPEVLMRLVTGLLEQVQGESTLALHVQQQIVADLKHVLWLLENVELYGISHAITATEQLAGRISVAGQVTRNSRLRRWGAAMVAVIALLADVSQVWDSDTYREAVGAYAHNEDDAREISRIVVSCLPPKAIEGPPAERQPGDDPNAPIDAELVDD